MVTSHAVPNFLPSEDGLHFPNSYPSGPTVRIGPLDPRLIGVGDASMGLCGGMCYFVKRKFKANQPVPAQTTVPDNSSASRSGPCGSGSCRCASGESRR